MKTLKRGAMVRNLVREWRKNGETVAFVPTMGNLHRGHLSLVERAASSCDRVVVSIFVNPTQFGPQEDFKTYPRTLKKDLQDLASGRVDCCFTPSVSEIYQERHATQVRIPSMESTLEGTTRPTHFAGVLLVVLKLLHIAEPDLLMMGQKDAQQAVLIEAMIRDLNLPTRLLRGRIIREPNGLALSSRNANLSSAQSEAASALHRGLVKARRAAREGVTQAQKLKKIVAKEIQAEKELKLDYVACVNAQTLKPLSRIEGKVLLPGAVYAGNTRLIDNEQFVVRK
jgi:pantoate--beta-alanine ligase